jgi:putative transposase
VGLGLQPDFLREAIRVMSELVMELEVSQQIGAERYERSDKRTTQRNGYGERTWETRVGEIDLHSPKLRQGSYYPSLLEPRRRAEQALLAVIQQAYIEGVSVRRVDDLLKALGLTGLTKVRCPGSVSSLMAWSSSFASAHSREPIRICGWMRSR